MSEPEHDPDRPTVTWVGAPLTEPSGEFPLPPRWRPERLVGRGGQGDVWLAFDETLREPVAVKVLRPGLSPEAMERVRREVLIGRRLQHANLVRVYEFLDLGGRHAVVMEWVPGGSVADQLAHGPLPIDDVIRFAGDALAGLAHLHGGGVVHRDVKPSNLLLDADGRVRLADLGLARWFEETREMTRTDVTVGTPTYMSPEQIRGATVGPPSDLYSLGATLHHLLTGRPPFEAESEFGLATQHLQRSAPDPRQLRPDCPEWLARFVRRLLAKRPGDRYRDAAAARSALESTEVGISPALVRRALVAVATLAACGVLALTVARVWRGRPAAVTATPTGFVVTDARGRELWRRDDLPIYAQPVVADLLGRGAGNVAVARLFTGNGFPAGTENVVVFDASGREQTRLAAVPARVATLFPELAPRFVSPALSAVDLDGDGRDELFWRSLHGPWYPSVLGVWVPSYEGDALRYFANSGSLNKVQAADLDGDGVRELVAFGVNNPIGYQIVLAIVQVRVREWATESVLFASPDHVANWHVERSDRGIMAYVPLGAQEPVQLARLGADGIELEIGNRTVRLDSSGNPEGSPLFGRGGGPRSAAWNALAAACVAVEGGTAAAKAFEPLFARHPEAFAEAPMGLAARLLAARSLARAGRHGEAVAMLRRATELHPGDVDAWLRLGEQLGIVGELPAAAAALAEAMRPHASGRRPLDAVISLALLAALHGDAPLRESVIATWLANETGPDGRLLAAELRALASFCRGEFGAPALDPAPPYILLPAGAVVRAWAALERGADPAVTIRTAGPWLDDPESREPARLLVATARLRLGQARAAAEVAAQALAVLEPSARTSVEARLLLPLAHRVLADALAATGDASAAHKHAARAAALAPRCWFGGQARRP
jgi:serine/threonine-protein kinase